MTKEETLRLALDTLKEVREETFRLLKNGERLYSEDKVWSTIITIQESLEAKDEPVAWGMETDGLIYDVICPAEHEREEGEYTIPLYTHPKEWVGLKDDDEIPWDGVDAKSFAKAIEAKLKEKNNLPKEKDIKD